MDGLVAVELDRRAVLRIGGPERTGFLQNLVSADVARVAGGHAVWSALLTPQGKYLADFFLYPSGDSFLLDTEAELATDLQRRLTLYRLRAKVTIEQPDPALHVYALLGDGAAAAAGLPSEPGACRSLPDGVAAVDPRPVALGVRVVSDRMPELPMARPGRFADWDRARLLTGVPDGTRDLVVEKTTLLEAGFDELGGVDFAKGCYVGQELTARMKYRGLLKKRLLPVAIEGEAPPPGTPLLGPDGREAGEMRSACGDLGLALVRLEAFDQQLTAGASRLRVRRPAWVPPG
jgi:folate-binding protein YgfZ